MSANEKQEGGKHYKELNPQPWDVIQAWGLGFLDGNVVKYVARWRAKGGVEDLKKARHYLDKQIEEMEKLLASQGASESAFPSTKTYGQMVSCGHGYAFPSNCPICNGSLCPHGYSSRAICNRCSGETGEGHL